MKGQKKERRKRKRTKKRETRLATFPPPPSFPPSFRIPRRRQEETFAASSCPGIRSTFDVTYKVIKGTEPSPSVGRPWDTRRDVTRLSRHLEAKDGNSNTRKSVLNVALVMYFIFPSLASLFSGKMATTRERHEILARLDCDADLFTSAKLLWFSYSIFPANTVRNCGRKM